MAQPVTASRFAIVVDGVEIASFTTCTGPVDKVIRPPRPGSPVPTILPPHAELRHGTGATDQLIAWYLAATAGASPGTRRDCALVGYLPDGNEALRFRLLHAWPSTLTWPRASGPNPLVDSLTLVFESFQRI